MFTSPRAVERLVPLLRDARAFGLTRIAAIGPGTAEELARHGLVADLVPHRFIAEALLESFAGGPGRVLLPRAAVARDVLPEGLRAKGWTVEVVEAYRTAMARPDPAALAAAAGADAITFTSSSTVTNYLAVAGPGSVPPFVACIGPVTAEHGPGGRARRRRGRRRAQHRRPGRRPGRGAGRYRPGPAMMVAPATEVRSHALP